MEETLQELERPAVDDSQQPGPEEDGTTAIVQITPSSVIHLTALHAFEQALSHLRLPMRFVKAFLMG